jgi:hypothetical protein
MTDPLNSPVHFIGKQWACIDIVEALGLDFHRGNALAHIARHKQNGGDQDIAEARWYLQRLLGSQTLIASIAFGKPNNHAFAAKMTADAIADNFDISDAYLHTAIANIRASTDGSLPVPDIQVHLRCAVRWLSAYLNASQAGKP